jgi:hypothetical protein
MKAVLLLSKTFFPAHPKAGEETHFANKVLAATGNQTICPEVFEEKKHTCRRNYEYWKKKIDRLKATGGELSIRQWSGKPYRSKQEIVATIPAEDVEVQRLSFHHNPYGWTTCVDSRCVPIATIASNDGLTKDDFVAWFTPALNPDAERNDDFAIIHLTKFRY